VTDIVERLRQGALSGDLPLGVSFNWNEAADEIERLRAEVGALQALYEQRRELLRNCDTEVRALRREKQQLQALIDAYAEAHAVWAAAEPLSTDQHEQMGVVMEMRNALLAAATPQEAET